LYSGGGTNNIDISVTGRSLPNYGCPSIRGRVPGLPIVLPGWGDPCANFLGSAAVVFWGFWVRCGRVKLVSKSLGSILGVIAEFRMPTYKGEGSKVCDWLLSRYASANCFATVAEF